MTLYPRAYFLFLARELIRALPWDDGAGGSSHHCDAQCPLQRQTEGGISRYYALRRKDVALPVYRGEGREGGREGGQTTTLRWMGGRPSEDFKRPFSDPFPLTFSALAIFCHAG
jgi:hypothetical protein